MWGAGGGCLAVNAVPQIPDPSWKEGCLPSAHLPPSGVRPGRASFPEQPPRGQTAGHLTWRGPGGTRRARPGSPSNPLRFGTGSPGSGVEATKVGSCGLD